MFGRRCRFDCCRLDDSAYEHEAHQVDAPVVVDGEAPIDWTEMQQKAKGVTALQPVIGTSTADAKLIMSDPACVKDVGAKGAAVEPCSKNMPFLSAGGGMKKVVEPEDDDDTGTTGQPEEEPSEPLCRRESGLFEVVLIKKNCKKVGIDVNHFAKDDAITVQAITGGLAQEWNEAHPEDVIEIGDVIIEVNGIMGDVSQMLAKCRDEANLTFTVVKHRVYNNPHAPL